MTGPLGTLEQIHGGQWHPTIHINEASNNPDSVSVTNSTDLLLAGWSLEDSSNTVVKF